MSMFSGLIRNVQGMTVDVGSPATSAMMISHGKNIPVRRPILASIFYIKYIQCFAESVYFKIVVTTRVYTIPSPGLLL